MFDGGRLVLPHECDLNELATLFTACFYDGMGPEVPPYALEELRRSVPPEMARASPREQEHWRTTAAGLRSRIGMRLRCPTLAPSTTNSLVVALAERCRLVACCELSIRPPHGLLPGRPAQRRLAASPALLTSPPLVAYCSSLGVEASLRGRGVGRRMLRACEWLVAREWGMTELHLHVDQDNVAAAALYHAMGYDPLPAFDNVCAEPGKSFRYSSKRLVVDGAGAMC
uniref:N-acetyltransferase domain-containing protein n=1 Tax=Haptolina ericina TaxID=156174 RepID=A0A7S3ARN3_9EUKA